MDDLSSKISSILSDPRAMEQIKGLGEMLGLSDDSASSMEKPQTQQKSPQHNSADNNTSENILSSFIGGDNNTMNMLTRLVPLMSNIKQDDDTTRLLNSLRPFLSYERQSKLDSALRLLRIMKLLPIIKDAGILDSII